MKKSIFKLLASCFILTSCNTTQSTMKNTTSLEGTWELNYISGTKIAFEGMFPDKKPTIEFNLNEKRVSGNNSCNSYTGQLKYDGNTISFKDPMAVTRMMCMNNQGEDAYMGTLLMVDSYTISKDGKTLTFSTNSNMVLRYDKK